MEIIIPYIITCVICAVLAKRIFIGFWGGFFLSLLVTPIAGLLIIFLLRWMKARSERNRLLKDPALFEAVNRYHRARKAQAKQAREAAEKDASARAAT